MQISPPSGGGPATKKQNPAIADRAVVAVLLADQSAQSDRHAYPRMMCSTLSAITRASRDIRLPETWSEAAASVGHISLFGKMNQASQGWARETGKGGQWHINS